MCIQAFEPYMSDSWPQHRIDLPTRAARNCQQLRELFALTVHARNWQVEGAEGLALAGATEMMRHPPRFVCMEWIGFRHLKIRPSVDPVDWLERTFPRRSWRWAINKREHLTQEQVHATIHNWRNGKNKPKAPTSFYNGGDLELTLRSP